MANKVVRLVAGLGATSVIAVSGAALANSQTAGAAHQQAQHHQIRHHHAGRGLEAMRHRGTPVKGAELAKVEAAIKAKDSSVTVERVFQGPKGAFHAMGTQGGKRVHIKVSKDLKTVTVKAAGARHGRGPHHPGAQASAGSAAASA